MEEVFFALMRAGLWGKDNDNHNPNDNFISFKDVDWEKVYNLASEQSVVGLVAAGLDSFKFQDSSLMCPLELKLQMIGEALQIEQQNADMNKFIARLVGKMRDAGIYTLLVKGQGVAQCYEKPLWRSCGDVDLFLSDDNYEKAKMFLKPLASEIEEEYVREKHFGMTIDGWVVELHGRLYSGLSSKLERELDKVYKDTFYGGAVRSWDNNVVQVFMLKAENDVFYIFTHILQHFFKEGLGLRQVCDWCRLLYIYRGKLDLRLLESRIRNSGLMREWCVFAAFAVKWLGMPVEAMPLYNDNDNLKKKADKIMDFILMSGNMGHNRDTSYMKYPFVIRKFFSAGRRIGDLFNHARIFPMDSLRFSFAIMKNGVKSAIRGEG